MTWRFTSPDDQREYCAGRSDYPAYRRDDTTPGSPYLAGWYDAEWEQLERYEQRSGGIDDDEGY